MAGNSFPPRTLPELKAVSAAGLARALGAGSAHDAVVLVTAGPFQGSTKKELAALRAAVEAAAAADAALFAGAPALACVPAPGLAGNRLVVTCTGALDRDIDDVRRWAQAGAQERLAEGKRNVSESGIG